MGNIGMLYLGTAIFAFVGFAIVLAFCERDDSHRRSN